MADDGNRDVLLRVDGLGVRAGGRTLFSGASFEVRAGDVVLVVGPSGTGKTVLLRVLAGLLGPGDRGFDVEGTVELRSHRGPGPGQAGIVFQDFALFDDLTMAGNLRFGADHARRRESGRDRSERVARVASELEVPLDVAVGQASRGQRQRAALARTLAFDADVILFDEPTSGLDPRQSRRVVERISRTVREYGRAAVVVTHEHEYVADVADAAYLLDPAACALVPVDRDGLRSYGERDEADEVTAPPPGPGVAGRALRTVGDFFAATTGAVEEAFAIPWWLLPLWRSPRWGLRHFLRYFSLVAFPSAVAYIALAGLITGVVTTYFTFEYFPLKQYTEPIIIEDILASLGYAQYRIIVPVLVSILVAARCGAAVTADVGNRVYSQQVEALRSFGAAPRRYLYTNILWAFLLGVPLLTVTSFAVSQFASLLVYVTMHPESSPVFWEHHFFSQLRSGGTFFAGTEWLAAKMTAAGLGTAAVSYACGVSPKPSAGSVNGAITSAVIRCTLLALAVHALFAFFEFRPLG